MMGLILKEFVRPHKTVNVLYIYHDRQASGGKDKDSIVTFGIPFMNHYRKSTDMTACSFLNVPGENITATLSKVKKQKTKQRLQQEK